VSDRAWALGENLAVQTLRAPWRKLFFKCKRGSEMMQTFVRGLLIASVFCLTASYGTTLGINMNRDLGTYPIGSVQVNLIASGGSGNYTWKLASGTLPAGVNIASAPGNRSQVALLGIATCAGCVAGGNTYNFSLTVNDGTTSVTQPFEMRVTTLTLMDINLPDAFVGKAFSHQFTALNAQGGTATFDATAPGLPVGLTLSPGGVLSGTMPDPGTYQINLSIFDGVDEIYRGFQLNVYQINMAVTNAPAPGVLPNAVQNETYTATLTASGGMAPYQFSGCCLPGGLSLSNAGVISGNANSGPGLYGFNVQVTDAAGNFYQKTMSIDIVPGGILQNRITLGTIDDAVVGQNYSWQIPTCCGGVAPFTWSATGLPPGMSIRSGSDVTQDYVVPGWGEIWGVPSAPGNYPVVLTVKDANGNSSSLSFTFHVSELNLAPGYNLPNGTIGQAYLTTFEILGGVPPYATVQQVNGYIPDGLSLKSANPAPGFFTVSGTPLENGSFDPEFTITDSKGNTLTRNNYFNINNPSGITIQGQSLFTPTVGTPINTQLNACCAPSFVWSYTGTLPPGISISSSGQVTGTFTTVGTYTVLLKAANATNLTQTGFKQITVVVTPINITTTTTNGNLPAGYLLTPYNETLTATGGTGTLTWSLLPGNYVPPGLKLATSSGVLSGTPTGTGQYFFQVIVKDTGGNEATVGYGMNIYGQSQLPPISVSNGPNLGTWNTGTDFIGLGVNGGNGTYTYSLVSGKLPPGLSLSTKVPSFFAKNQQAGLIGVAVVNTPSTYNFSIKITSGGQPYGGASVIVPYQLTISPLNLQDATPPDGFVNVPFSYQFTPINNKGPVAFTVGCTFQGCSPPPGLNLSGSGLLSGKPTQAGSFQIALCLNDGVSNQCEQYNLQVYAVQITTPGILPANATAGNTYSATLAASGGTGTGYTFNMVGGGLPPGLSLASNGHISGTVNAGAGPGIYGFAVQVTDSGSNTGFKRMSLDVVGPATGMRINSTWFNDPVLGDRYGNVGNLCCGGTGPFTWTVTGLPPGMTYEPNSNSYNNYPSFPGGVQLYGIPQQAGTYNVTFTVTDANNAKTSAVVAMHVSVLDVLINGGGGFGFPGGTIDTAYSGATFQVIGGTGPYAASQTANGEMPDGLKFAGLTLSGTPLENGGFGQEYAFTDSTTPTPNALTRNEGIFIASAAASNININCNGWFCYYLGTYTGGTPVSRQLGACCAASYVWSVPTGQTLPPGLKLSASGLLSGTLPKVTSTTTYRFLVEAANASNLTDTGLKSFALTVTPITITTASLPAGTKGTAYNTSLTATGTTGTVTWSQPYNEGSLLPPGLTLNAAGTITGTPTSPGSYFVILEVTDGSKNTAIQGYFISIAP
jgi:hypothetical protein